MHNIVLFKIEFKQANCINKKLNKFKNSITVNNESVIEKLTNQFKTYFTYKS